MATDLEVQEALAQTRHLVEREPTEIIITRPAPDLDDGAGGRVRGPQPITLEPQTAFVSGVTRDSDYRQSSFSQGETGESFVNAIVIVGMPGLNINQYDTFMKDGLEYKVTFVHPFNGYEVRAEGTRVTSGGR